MNFMMKSALTTVTGLVLTHTAMAQKPAKIKLADDMKPIKGAEMSLVSLTATSNRSKAPPQVVAVYKTFDGNTVTQSGSDRDLNGEFGMSDVSLTHVENPTIGLDLTIKHSQGDTPAEQTLKRYVNGMMVISIEKIEQGAVGKLMNAFQESLHTMPPTDRSVEKQIYPQHGKTKSKREP